VRKSLVALVAVAALGATASGCGSSGGTSSSTAAQPLRILLEAPISSSVLGPNAQTAVNAAKAALAVVNKAGGVLGHPVQLTVVDDAGDPTTAVTKLQSALASSDKPAVFIQADASPEAEAELPILTQNKVVSFNQAPTATSSDPKVTPYNFDLSPSTPNYAAAFCPAIKAKGYKTFAILHGDDAFADPEAAAIASQCQALGLKMTGDQQFELTALDLTPQLSALESGHPDVLVVSSYGAPSGYVLNDLNRLQWKVPLLGDDAFMVSPVITSPPPSGMLGTALESNARALVFASTVYSAHAPAAVTDMINGMKALGPIPAPLILAYAYDAVILAAAGAKSAGTTTDGAKIANAVVALKAGTYQTAIFPAYHFTATSHAANIDPTAFAFVKPSKVINGQFGAPGSS
jgi:branched-chain amino acid transport system substrate-binding protein